MMSNGFMNDSEVKKFRKYARLRAGETLSHRLRRRQLRRRGGPCPQVKEETAPSRAVSGFLGYSIFALYSSPQAHIESRIGLRLLPNSVREYSTLGGTSA